MANGRARVGPEWTSAITQLTLIVTIVSITAALYWAKGIFIPIALAVVMTFVLAPAVSRLQRWGVGRTTAVALVVVLTLGMMVSVGAVVTQQLVTLGETLPDHSSNIVSKIRSAKAYLLGSEKSRLGRLLDDVMEAVNPSEKTPATDITFWGARRPASAMTTPQRVVVEQESTSWWDNARTFLGPAGEILATVALAGVLVVFMLLRREDLRNRMIRLIGNGRITTTTKAVDDAATRISRYLLTQLGLNSAFGVVITMGLVLIGLPYPVLWGFLAFLMRYVPYVGTWIGVIPPALFSLAMSDGWSQPAMVFALFIGLELLCNNIFEPMLYSSSLGLSEVAQLVAAAFWAFLWGPVGLILSGPLTVCLLVLGKYSRRLEFLNILLGDEPALSARMAFYQRLAARDEDEAVEIAMQQLKHDSSEEVFDEVVVPALALAKRDRQGGQLSDENFEQAVATAREVSHEVDDEIRRKQKDLEPNELPNVERIPVLLVPGRDEADGLAVEIFARQMDRNRWMPEVVAEGTLASELVEAIRKTSPGAAIIASLPPTGLAHTRYLVSRIRAMDPEIKILVGRWGFSDDLGEEPETTGIEGVDWWSNSMKEALRQLHEWSPVLRENAEAVGDARRRTPRGGEPVTAVTV